MRSARHGAERRRLLEDANRVCTVVARFRPQNKVELGSGGQPIVRFENDETCNIDVSDRFGIVDVGSWRDADSGIVPRGVRGLHLRPRLPHGLFANRYLRLFYSPYG